MCAWACSVTVCKRPLHSKRLHVLAAVPVRRHCIPLYQLKIPILKSSVPLSASFHVSCHPYAVNYTIVTVTHSHSHSPARPHRQSSIQYTLVGLTCPSSLSPKRVSGPSFSFSCKDNLLDKREGERERKKERKDFVVAIEQEVEEEEEKGRKKERKSIFQQKQKHFHQFIAPRTTLPLHLSFPLHASSTSPTTFLPFDPYNPITSQSQQHHFPLQTNLFHPLHPPSPPTHKHKLPSIHLTDSWSNDELLALFRIRSTMENCFPEHTWDHVSSYSTLARTLTQHGKTQSPRERYLYIRLRRPKLGELGFKKSAEKCKEKFEDESGYFDNVSNYGKNNYRFLSELEELCQNPDSGGGGDCDGDDGIVRSEKTLLHLGADNMGHRICDGTDDKVVVEKSKERKRKRRDRFEMFKGFCESFVNKMMAQQEEIHNRLLEDMVKRDQEKFAREEAWKKQEMERMNKELDIMAQEQAIAGDRHATIIEFLKKCATTTTITSTTSPSPPSQNANCSSLPNRSLLHSLNPNSPSNEDNNLDPTPTLLNHDQTKLLRAENPSSSETLLQVPSSSNSSPTPHNPTSSLNSQNNTIPLESNSVSTYKTTSTTPPGSTENSKDDVGRRWPRDEVLALINLRCTSVSNNNNSGSEEKEGNNKGPLWERISQGMSEVGYKRSAKRCKEKWENINKYFRKTKDVNKKRSLNSRTCPYFHQLSCLYGQGKIVAAQSEREGNYMSPTANSGQMPPDVDDEDESSHVGSGGLDHYAC
ncbi:hypothetical protein V8G54_032456 [Vigna mungo]|uniref:Myb-like domain-containing protein n=1 Tax=Vigna mungo TaxID=3915 RepID=A0AAQ3MM70_VIGMU